MISTGYAQVYWVQLGEETWVLDLTTGVGDRGLASLNLMDEASCKYGILRHVLWILDISALDKAPLLPKLMSLMRLPT
ncbi:MAG: hypothetical protein ACKPKO_61530, partial [Candidatus Fonsibacter sp.]